MWKWINKRSAEEKKNIERKQIGSLQNEFDEIAKKRMQEKQMLRFMLEVYCRKRHGKPWCEECEKLYAYACMRITHCPFMATKTFCSSCKVHCYRPEERLKIQEVMRFSGPWMLLYHPKMALAHMGNTLRYTYEKRCKTKKKGKLL